MLLLFHISIAISSLLWATYVCLAPTTRKLHISYSLIALTIASGTYLVISLHSGLVESCLTGLIYSAVALIGVRVAKQRLVKITT